MARISISVTFEWEPVGPVTLDRDDKLVFPKTPLRPGLYRFEVEDREGPMVYFGETDQLARRLQHYRTPGPSQRTNLRLNALMRETLAQGRGISLAVVTDGALISMVGTERPADLSQKPERVLLEHAALCEALESGISVLNA